MLNRTTFVLGACSLILFTTTNVAAMDVANGKTAGSSSAATEHNVAESQNTAPTVMVVTTPSSTSDVSGKDEKKTAAQAKTEVLVRQLGTTIFLTAPQPKTKMCATGQNYPLPNMLNNADIKHWYEIGDGEHTAPRNEVLWNLVATVKDHFNNNVFPRYKYKNILVVFDIDETAITHFGYWYKYYQKPPIGELDHYINFTRDCGANKPILDLYNFFKTNGCAVVFISSRKPRIDIQGHNIPISFEIQFEQLTWQGLRRAGYDVDEKDVYLCGDHALKKNVRLTLKQQAFYTGRRFDYAAAIDDDFSVLVEGDDLDCGIWVPSSYHVDNAATDYYKKLEALPDFSAPTAQPIDDIKASSAAGPTDNVAGYFD